MPVFRTPDDRFRDLPAYSFEPHYHSMDGPSGETLRTHYVDTGAPGRDEAGEDSAPDDPAPDDSAPVVCLHGEPTWSYMYRTVIPPVAREHRVVAPDFVGFGRSDKLTSPGAYSLELGVEQLRSLLDTLDLAGVTLVVHDWGGLIGLAYAAHYPERIARLVILNTFLPVGDENEKSRGFLAWRRYVEQHPDLPVGDVMKRAMQRDDHWSDALQAAYDAPFPTPEAKAGAATWPLLIPMSPDTPLARTMQRTRERLARWSKPAFVLFAPNDPILGQAHAFFRSLLPTAQDQPEVFLDDAGHFVPEEQGPVVAQHILDFIDRTPREDESPLS